MSQVSPTAAPQFSLSDNNHFIKNTFRAYLLPTVFVLFSNTVGSLINNIVAGQTIGADGLAAMVIVSPLYFVYAALGALIGIGAPTLAATYVGQDDPDGFRKVYSTSLLLATIAGLAAAGLMLALIRPLLSLLGAGPELYDLAYDYAIVFIPGGIACLLIYLPLNYLRTLGYPKLGVVIFSALAVLSVGLNLLLAGVWQMGLAGVALATVVSNALAAALGFFLLRLCKLPGHWKDALRLARPTLSFVRPILKTGSPMALNNLLTVIRTVCLNQILLSTGEDGVMPAFSLIASVNTFASAILMGVPQTVLPLISIFKGERDTRSIRHVLRHSLLTGFACTAVVAVLLFLLASFVADLFGYSGGEPEAVAVNALRIFCVSLLPSFLNFTLTYYYSALGYIDIANLMTALRGLALAVPLAFALSSALGAVGVWWSMALLEVLATLILIPMLYRKKRKQSKLTAFWLLDETGSHEGRDISFAVPLRAEAIVDASTQISEFCDHNDLDPKRGMAISLSIEEMLTLIGQYCFGGDERQEAAVRVFVHKDVVVMRIRNNGKRFNPIEDVVSSDDEFDERMGINIILGMAETILYSRALGVNNLTIVL